METIIWRESIYKRDFVCKCGAKLFDTRTNRVTDNVVVDATKVDDKELDLFCVKCGLRVAKSKDIDEKYVTEKEKFDVLNGNINDWIAKKEKQAEKDGQELAEKKAMVKLKNQIEKLHKELQGYESQIKHQKEMYEKRIARKDKQIQELSKDITGLEARMKQMEQAMVGKRDTFTNMRDS